VLLLICGEGFDLVAPGSKTEKFIYKKVKVLLLYKKLGF